tara:strand:+ start:1269 stop:1418 length:150 start_codon:yes stop_codon:yes gene_type:complete
MARHRGCEWDSPIFRQIMAEKQGKQSKQNKEIITEYKTKRGKYNGREQR